MVNRYPNCSSLFLLKIKNYKLKIPVQRLKRRSPAILILEILTKKKVKIIPVFQ